jgi:hypothetical protein
MTTRTSSAQISFRTEQAGHDVDYCVQALDAKISNLRSLSTTFA